MEHPHKLCCLRQELVEAFVESRYMSFIKLAAYHLQTLGLKKQLIRDSSAASATNEDEGAEDKPDAIEDKVTATEAEINLLNENSNKAEENAAKKMVESITNSPEKTEGNKLLYYI